MNAHGVIMAGGSGTRLWPLSRKARPKQLLRLFDGQSLLRQAFERLATVLPADRIYVITAAAHLPAVAAELPELPEDNLFGEPEGRDTANAIALAAAILHRRDPEALMGVFTADHIIEPADRFSQAVTLALATASKHPRALVTMGITVRSPETAFGYVRRGKTLAKGVYRVAEFKEKPDRSAAEAYAASGEYLWNSGMFAWTTAAILDELRTHLPETFTGAQDMAAAWDGSDREAKLRTIYPQLEKTSIDYAVMERAAEVLVVEMDCTWADVGSWAQLAEVLPGDAAGNVSAARRVCHLGSGGVTVVSDDEDHLIATVGLDDVAVVHTADVTLICRLGEAQKIKDLLAQVETEFGERYS